jgi:GNAT superfamily N-acetyltransferase
MYLFKYLNFAEALYQALSPDSFYIAMENSVAGNSIVKKEAMLRYMDYSMIEAEIFGELFIPTEHQYGTSVWAKPLSKELENEKKLKKKSFLADHMGASSLKVYTEITDFMSSKVVDWLPADSWYLSIIGILPEFQGRGLGADLINAVLTKTDALGAPTYLETFTPRNMSFYKRLGYQEVASFIEPNAKARYWVMSRMAELKS